MSTTQRQIRLDDDTWAWLQQRGRELGPVKALNPSEVIRWLIEQDRIAARDKSTSTSTSTSKPKERAR